MAKKTENDALLERPSSPVAQLALPLAVKSEEPDPVQRAKRENVEASLAHVRNWAQDILKIAQRLFPEAGYIDAKLVSNEHWVAAREKYEQGQQQRFQPPHPDLWKLSSAELIDAPSSNSQLSKPKKETVYQPWPLERRQQAAVRSLLKRAKKRSTFPEWWQNWIQAELLKDPWRFGVCPLPSEGSCIIPDPGQILIRERAIAREIQLREQEQGLVQPLKMPLSLKQPEYVAVEVESHAANHR